MPRKSRNTPPRGRTFRFILVRHAQAAEAAEFDGPDLDRPLTSKGWKTARKFFQRLETAFGAPRVIVHSAARRARETAEALQESFPNARLTEDPALNPGAAPGVFRKLAAGARDTLVVVGHEPDLSAAITDFTGGRCRMRKATIAVLEPVSGGFELAALIDPSLLRRQKAG